MHAHPAFLRRDFPFVISRHRPADSQRLAYNVYWPLGFGSDFEQKVHGGDSKAIYRHAQKEEDDDIGRFEWKKKEKSESGESEGEGEYHYLFETGREPFPDDIAKKRTTHLYDDETSHEPTCKRYLLFCL